MRLLAPAIFLVALALAPPGAHAQGAPERERLLVFHRGGVAIYGYDVVAYHRAGEARRGLPIFEVEHGGYLWHFESDLNAERFRDDPQRYVPAYGGFGALGVAEGYLTDGDPETWSVRDGRTYLFFSPSLLRRWLEDAGANIRRADRNWLRLTPP